MSVINPIEDKANRVKRLALIEKELQQVNGVGSPFWQWLYSVKRISPGRYGYHPESITPELWAEWLAAKPAILAKQAAIAAERATKQQADYAAERDAARDVAERDAKRSERADAEIARLQAYPPFKPLVLEPVDFEELHALKKHPEQSKLRLAKRWRERFTALPADVQIAWMAFHQAELVAMPGSGDVSDAASDDASESDDDVSASAAHLFVHLNEYPPGQRNVYEGNLPGIKKGFPNPAYQEFRRFSEGVRRMIGLIGNPIDSVIVPPHDPHRPQAAVDLDDIPDNSNAVAYIVPGLMPRGWTIPHGDAGAGKSLFCQKLAIVIADDTGATFEGIEVEHGPVIYSTLDPSASPAEVKPGLVEIRARLGLKPSGRLHMTGAPIILNEPSSVEHWLELNRARLPAKMIVVDSLFSSTTGSLAQDITVEGVCDGVTALLRHADAVVTPHHDNKSGDIFGSQYLTAMLAAKYAIARPALKDGRPGGHVNVTVERLKRADSYLKLAYTLDGPFLALGESAGALAADAMPIRRPDILAALPTTATPLGEARALIEHMLTGTTAKSRETEWKRLRDGWLVAKLIVVTGNTIRRKA